MAQDIVSGLFGLAPYQVAQQQQREIDTDAAKFAQMNAAQRGTMGLYQGGAGLAGMAGGMLGIENPAMVEAQQRQAALTGLDISSPESILARAQQIQDPKLKMQLMMMADQKKKEAQALAMEATKIEHEKFKMGEEFKWKQQQAKDALEQKAEAARLRSEDARLSAQQRADAAREANQTRLLIAQMVAATKQGQQAQKSDLPTPALKLQQEELDAIGTTDMINKDLNKYQTMIENKTLDLGLLSNLISRGKNIVGRSDPQSQAFANFKADMEKLRNDSLRLNKGTQTEGDAVRAWNELFENITDPEVVKSRLQTIEQKNNQAMEYRMKNVNTIRRNFKAGDFDFSEYKTTSPVKPTGAKTGVPAGVDPAVWAVMTEQEKSLWLK